MAKKMVRLRTSIWGSWNDHWSSKDGWWPVFGDSVCLEMIWEWIEEKDSLEVWIGVCRGNTVLWNVERCDVCIFLVLAHLPPPAHQWLAGPACLDQCRPSGVWVVLRPSTAIILIIFRRVLLFPTPNTLRFAPICNALQQGKCVSHVVGVLIQPIWRPAAKKMTCHCRINEDVIPASGNMWPQLLGFSANSVAVPLDPRFAVTAVANLVTVVPRTIAEGAYPPGTAKEGNLVVSWKAHHPVNRRRVVVASVATASIAFKMRRPVAFGHRGMNVHRIQIHILHVNQRIVPCTKHVRMEKDMIALNTASGSVVSVLVVPEQYPKQIRVSHKRLTAKIAGQSVPMEWAPSVPAMWVLLVAFHPTILPATPARRIVGITQFPRCSNTGGFGLVPPSSWWSSCWFP